MRMLGWGLALLGLAGSAGAARAGDAADLVVTNARIMTQDIDHRRVEALAVRGGRIVYVGGSAGARALVGPATRVEDMHGRLVLPGLVDSHIHPTEIVQLDVCDLKSEAHTLAQMTEFVKACIARYHVAPGHWLLVEQWAFADGNQPDAAHPSLRVALDAASTEHPIGLLGNDGHHGAFNSAALARAHAPGGAVVGLTAASLAGPFKHVSKLVGVDAAGEPNGTVNEDARDLMDPPDAFLENLPELMKAPERITAAVNAAGITAMQDAAVRPVMLQVYDTLQARGQLSVHLNLALLYEPEHYRRADPAACADPPFPAARGLPPAGEDRPPGPSPSKSSPAGGSTAEGGDGGSAPACAAASIDYDRIVADASAVRARYANNPLIRADAVKLFADGVLEGNAFATPPTLPESPMLRPYLQPIFGRDGAGKLTVTGYVDTDSARCRAVRDQPPMDSAASAAFLSANGFAPAQCDISSGKLQHEPAVILEYLKRMHRAGFTLHIHAIGDAAVKIALDGIEAARASDGISSQPDTIAHFQIATDEDIARAGRDHLYIAYTYAWAYTDPMYDMMLIPFIDRVQGNGQAALHRADGSYERNGYPARATRDAGAVLVAGSDAPVDTRDPRPFVNMMSAVMRNGDAPANPGLNLKQAVSVRDALDAYTINGARALGRAYEIGSLEVGKSADFIVVDRDFVSLAEKGRPAEIGATKVLGTWFEGRRVYEARR